MLLHYQRQHNAHSFYSQNNMLILPHIAHYLFLHCGGGRIPLVILHPFKFKPVYHLCGLVPIQIAVVAQAAVGIQPVNKRCNVERVGCSVSALNNYLCYGCYKAADLRHRFPLAPIGSCPQRGSRCAHLR